MTDPIDKAKNLETQKLSANTQNFFLDKLRRNRNFTNVAALGEELNVTKLYDSKKETTEDELNHPRFNPFSMSYE
jgi:hypothetical protein